ncbi:DUF4190 domain-containing protein [Nocardia veterana]|uniref:DUF4190 domain-containing protein n=1 Tax=Nocardia veterana TaxID=132249 RepID=A0A7X6RK49_9NOCA|nr:DUF4190 domain-containing protein [Nocardia veterana]NKY88942.1 DUF4190 domain-containing protein [Nocardia veterana]
MTNPGDSDEWWKQYGGEGVSSDSGGHPSATPPPDPQAGYSSAPHQQPGPHQQSGPHQQPAQPTPPPPSYPSYPQPPQQPYGQPNYGYPSAPPYQPYGYAQPPQQGTNGLAIGSLIASILGLCTCIGSIVGIILGVIALNQIKERGGQGRGMALGGIWVGAVGIALTIVWIIINVAAANW